MIRKTFGLIPALLVTAAFAHEGQVTAAAGNAAADTAETRYPFDIPAGQLPDALRAMGRQAGRNIMFNPALVEGKSAPQLRDRLTIDEAITRILGDTNLTYEPAPGDTILIMEKAPVAQSPGAGRHHEGILRLARSEHANEQQGAAGAQDASTSPSGGPEEIVVTAQKKEQRLQDVPVPVTAVQSITLVETNQLRLQDYAARIPGLAIVPTTDGGVFVAIRGLSTGSGSSPAAITVDDVPFGPNAASGAWLVPDLDPGDLARVEVLRGPQGTLYGASSLGGLIKYVTVSPSTEGNSGRLSVGTTTVKNGDGLGYNARASANVRLSDTLALGVSGFTRQEPGFIDNDVLGLKGVNEQRVSGGRLSALWRPSDDWTLKLNAMLQRHRLDGGNEANAALGGLRQSNGRGLGAGDKEFQVYGAVLTGTLGSAELTSISGYNLQRSDLSVDVSAYSFLFGKDSSGADVTAANSQNDWDFKRFTQEIRLQAPIAGRVDGMLGAFYTSEDSFLLQTIVPVDPVSGATIENGYHLNSSVPFDYAEHAAFGNLTFHVTDRFDVQVGARQSWIRQSNQTTSSQSVFPPGTPESPVVSESPTVRAKTNAFTYLVTPTLRLSHDLMVYARLASGYRVGGVSDSICAFLGFPCQYDPDKSLNYELGMKGEFLERKLTVDASVYYIDWKDIQIGVLGPGGFSYTANAGRAKSEGVELSLESRPFSGLTIGGWVAWNLAELTKDFPDLSGHRGDRLPFGAEWSGRLSVNQEFSLTPGMSGFVEGAVSYVGKRGAFIGSQSFAQWDYPAYTKLDLVAGVRPQSGWGLNLFVTNLTDKRATHTGNPAQGTVIYIQPRTIGVGITRDF